MGACGCGSDRTVDLAPLHALMAEQPAEKGALIPLLQGAQGLLGYLPPEALRAIAEHLALPLSEVYGVATFYGQFHLEPRGDTVVKVCHGTACHVAGAPDVTAALEDTLDLDEGQTSDDMRFTLEGVACVGCCGLAPVVVVGEQVHGQMDAAKARKLGRALKRGAGQ